MGTNGWRRSLASVLFCLVLIAGPAALMAAKDQSRITPDGANGEGGQPGVGSNGDNLAFPDDEGDAYDPRVLPDLKPVELTLELARRAVDAFAEIGEKYNDRGLADYETLEEFVAKTAAGKEMEAEIRKFGFADVTAWNRAITTVSLAYSLIVDDQSDAIKARIAQVRADKSLDTATRARYIRRLETLIPTPANRKVVEALMNDPVYGPRLDTLLGGE